MDDEENARLREQVKRLQDRIQILERIVTDRGVETAAQIEALRERDQIGAEDKGKMDGGQLTAVLIVAIVMIAGIIRAKYGYSRRGRGQPLSAPQDSAETLRLREEVKSSRSAFTSSSGSPSTRKTACRREIESLRDR